MGSRAILLLFISLFIVSQARQCTITYRSLGSCSQRVKTNIRGVCGFGWGDDRANEKCQEAGYGDATAHNRHGNNREVELCCGERMAPEASPEDSRWSGSVGCPSADLKDRSGVKKRNVQGENQLGTCKGCASGWTDISDGIVFNWVDGNTRKLVLTDKYGNWVLDGELPKTDSNYRNTEDWDRYDWKGRTHGYDVMNFNGCVDRSCEHATTVQGGEIWTSCSSNPTCPSGYWADGKPLDSPPSLWEMKFGTFGHNCVVGKKQKCRNSECHTWGPASATTSVNTFAESSLNMYAFTYQGALYVLASIGLVAIIMFSYKSFNKTPPYTEVQEAEI